MIQVSRLLEQEASSILAFNRPWTEWYKEWFGSLPSNVHFVQNFRRIHCRKWIVRGDLIKIHFQRPFPDGTPSLQHRIPKQSIRLEAEAAVAQILKRSNSTKFMSVHRRAFERGEQACEGFVGPHEHTFCFGKRLDSNHTYFKNLSSSVIGSYCEVTHEIAQTHVKTVDGGQATSSSAQRLPPIVLFTDGQRADLDQTFPLWDNHSFPVQLWMMTLSDIHYGNPMSSVDYVVAHWRRGRRMVHLRYATKTLLKLFLTPVWHNIQLRRWFGCVVQAI